MKKYILKNNAGDKINETEASSLIEALNYFSEVEGGFRHFSKTIKSYCAGRCGSI